jgi:hypothetical protein
VAWPALALPCNSVQCKQTRERPHVREVVGAKNARKIHPQLALACEGDGGDAKGVK